jgi:hypothetical protein
LARWSSLFNEFADRCVLDQFGVLDVSAGQGETAAAWHAGAPYEQNFAAVENHGVGRDEHWRVGRAGPLRPKLFIPAAILFVGSDWYFIFDHFILFYRHRSCA